MSTSLRCTLCAINWPPKPDFNPCPSCGDVTFPDNRRGPEMDLDEAYSMKKHYEFERFYEEWDANNDTKRLRPTADHRLRFPFDPELAEK